MSEVDHSTSLPIRRLQRRQRETRLMDGAVLVISLLILGEIPFVGTLFLPEVFLLALLPFVLAARNCRPFEPVTKLFVVLGLLQVHDREGGHMRIHPSVSSQRLLALGGFVVQDYLERPALFRPNRFNPFQHGVNLVSDLLRGRTSYAASRRLIGSLSWRLGHALRLGRLRRLGRGYGGYYLCLKGTTLDHVEINRSLYTEAAQ